MTGRVKLEKVMPSRVAVAADPFNMPSQDANMTVKMTPDTYSGVAVDAIEPRHLVGEPLVRDRPLRQMAEHAPDEARVRVDPQLREIGDAACRPQPRDHRWRADTPAHPVLGGEALEHGEIGGFVDSNQARRVAVAILQFDHHALRRLFDHMRVGDDVAIGLPDEAAAQ